MIVNSTASKSEVSLLLDEPIQYYLKKCYNYAAKYSPDPSTQNGAMLVTSRDSALSCNCLPNGIERDITIMDRNSKLNIMEHAERNLIYKCAKEGIQTDGSTVIVNWFACKECARALIQAGVKYIIGHKACFDNTPERWEESIRFALAMLDEAGVKYYIYDGKVGSVRVKFNGQLMEF